MTHTLVPCLACHRHLRASSARCPFCGADRAPESLAPREVTTRVSRAVLFALGASMSLAGCGSAVPLYGAPVPPDATGDVADATPKDATPTDVTPTDATPTDVTPTDAADVADASADVPADMGGVRYGAPPAPDWV